MINHRFAGRFMARDYVTFREHTDDAGNTVWTFENVGTSRLKSAPAKVVHNAGPYRVIGVAWGDAIGGSSSRSTAGRRNLLSSSVRRAMADGRQGLAWRFWSYDWGTPTPGEHTVASLAISKDGDVQPTPDDPIIADKRTYWESNGEITRTVVIP